MLVIERRGNTFYSKNGRIFVEYVLPWSRDYDEIPLQDNEKLFIGADYFLLEASVDGVKTLVSSAHDGCIYIECARKLARQALERCKKKGLKPKVVMVSSVGVSCVTENGQRFDCD